MLPCYIIFWLSHSSLNRPACFSSWDILLQYCIFHGGSPILLLTFLHISLLWDMLSLYVVYSILALFFVLLLTILHDSILEIYWHARFHPSSLILLLTILHASLLEIYYCSIFHSGSPILLLTFLHAFLLEICCHAIFYSGSLVLLLTILHASLLETYYCALFHPGFLILLLIVWQLLFCRFIAMLFSILDVLRASLLEI